MSDVEASSKQSGAVFAATPHLWFEGTAAAAIQLYGRVFGATVDDLVQVGEGAPVLHALLRLGDASLMVADLRSSSNEPRVERLSASVWLTVADCDRVFELAVAADFTPLSAPRESFWGERIAKLRDPFGHQWQLASQSECLTDEEIERRRRQFLESLASRVGDSHRGFRREGGVPPR